MEVRFCLFLKKRQLKGNHEARWVVKWKELEEEDLNLGGYDLEEAREQEQEQEQVLKQTRRAITRRTGTRTRRSRRT
jgi:hypothetical protein